MATVTMTRLFIAGAWQEARAGAAIEATSPRPASRSGRSRRATATTRGGPSPPPAAAFPDWAAATAFERAAALRRIADACERRRDELARVLTLDQGKPLHAESYDEVDELVAMWRGAAEDGLRIEGIDPAERHAGRARAAAAPPRRARSRS